MPCLLIIFHLNLPACPGKYLNFLSLQNHSYFIKDIFDFEWRMVKLRRLVERKIEIFFFDFVCPVCFFCRDSIMLPSGGNIKPCPQCNMEPFLTVFFSANIYMYGVCTSCQLFFPATLTILYSRGKGKHHTESLHMNIGFPKSFYFFLTGLLTRLTKIFFWPQTTTYLECLALRTVG